MKDESKTFEARMRELIREYESPVGKDEFGNPDTNIVKIIGDGEEAANLAREADKRIAALSSTIEEARDLIASLLANEGYVFPNRQIPNQAKEFLGRTKK